MESFQKRIAELEAGYEALVTRPNVPDPAYNGIYTRYRYPILTAAHAPLFWRYDLDPRSNPYCMERIGVNAVMNSGAIKFNGRYLIMARVEGADRKSFFAVAESPNGIDNFRFWDYPVTMPEYGEPATNVYDMRLTAHEDGWIYGVFCVERKDSAARPGDLSSAVASAGIARTKDLVNWERLPDLKSRHQQRNAVLHPEFIDGKYAFYTRPQEGFIEAGNGGGIGWALIDDITHMGIRVNSVVITQYTGQAAADGFAKKLTMRGVKNYIHRPIKGYPTDIAYICSDEGYGANPYIETSRPLVVVTAPGPGSGKLATCLSQVYHEIRQGRVAGYAKFETFPIWNLPLKHPVNLAYEAATADLADVNMIDPFHLEAYGVTTVNYNRDVEAFPIVRNILSRITGDESVYKSPTDMGVNMAGYAIVDDEAVRAAASQEIIRRYYKALCDHKQGKGSQDAVDKIKRIMQELSLTTADRAVVAPALAKSESSGVAAAAIQLPDGPIVTGKASNLMSACSSCVLNAIKAIAGIDDSLTLISPIILEPILKLKIDILGSRSSVLKVDDVLAALSITAATNTLTARAMAALPKLRDCEMHSTCMLHSGDEGTLRKMGLRLTSEPEYPSKDLFF